MPRWILECAGCSQEFTHTQVTLNKQASPQDPSSWLGSKPEFPAEGASLECPNCRETAVYQRSRLIFRAE